MTLIGSALATITERHDNSKLSWFKKWLGGVWCGCPDPLRMKPVAESEVKWPDRRLSNFADWYRHLRQESDDYAYLQDLRNVISGFESMRLEVAGVGRREIRIRMESSAKKEYDFSELSDGQRVLIGLYGLLHFMVKPGSTTCFDEPDNFIALREVQPWLQQLLDRTESDDPGATSQVLIASHHPEVLDRMAFQEGLLLDRPDGRHVRIRPFSDPSQTGLSASEIVARGWENE